MKAQVIFYSALAFLLDLVASIPYAADLQRYSNQYQSRPSLESKFQSIPQRPYQNYGQRPYDRVYNNPAPQFQEQELPRINRDHYFRNQQQYVNKGPPQIQPERFINQQGTQNEYYPNNNFQEAVLHKQVDNWRGANQHINEGQPVKIAYPEGPVVERNSEYRSHPQQVIQQNRFPENVRNEEREISSPVEEPYPFRQNPIFNENPKIVGTGFPQQEIFEHLAPTRNVNTGHLKIVNTPQQQSRPQILNEETFSPSIPSAPPRIEETFSPSIPSIPPRNSYLDKDVLKRVGEHYLQVEPVVEHQIPIVPPPPKHVEYGIPLSASETHLARAGNPVEQTPEPQVQQKPNAEKYFTNPRIQDVYFANKHKKRYLVIYPDGRIKHEDDLETIAKEHPNYVLVNAGDIVPKTTEKDTPSSPVKPVQGNKPTNAKTVPANKKTVPSFTYEAPGYEVDVLATKPSTHAPEAISSTTPASLTPTTSHVPYKPKSPPSVITKTTVTTPAISTPEAVTTQSTPKATAISSTHQATTTVPTPHTPSTQPTPQTETTTFTPVDTYPHAPQMVTTTPASQPQTTTPVPLPQTTPSASLETGAAAPIPSTPSKEEPSEVENDKKTPSHFHNDSDEDVQHTLNASEETSTSTTESYPVTDIQSTTAHPEERHDSDNPPQTTPHSISTSESSQPSTLNEEEETSTNPTVTDSTPQPDKTTPSPVPASEPQQDKKTATGVETEDEPQDATAVSENSDKAPLVVPVLYDSEDDSPKDIDEFILEEASNKVEPNPDEEVPDLGDSDVLEKVPHKPAVWFRTSDPNFWSKLMKKNTDFDVVYFFQIHNQPKIVQDKKTTIFPNGTILEEFTETSWEYDGAEPKVKKTCKLTNPEEQ